MEHLQYEGISPYDFYYQALRKIVFVWEEKDGKMLQLSNELSLNVVMQHKGRNMR